MTAVCATKSYAMFCSFCFHSKRPEAEFSAHWVKDKKNGEVTCPLLLANECGYCHEKGHTPKFCPRLKSRAQRRKVHEQRFASRPSQMHGSAKLQEQIKQKEATAERQKRERLRCSDNQYAELMGVKAPPQKRGKPCCAGHVHGPKPSAAAPLQGAWAPPPPARNLSADEVLQLKELLSKMGIADLPKLNDAEQQFINQQLNQLNPQTLEETADGEAFFDNNLDAEDAVEARHIAQPLLERQGAFAYDPACQPDVDVAMPVPLKPGLKRQQTTAGKQAFADGTATREEAIAMDLGVAGNPPPSQLPDDCDLDADFGEAGDDGWGSD